MLRHSEREMPREKDKISHLCYSFSFDATFQLNWNMCKIGTQTAWIGQGLANSGQDFQKVKNDDFQVEFVSSWEHEMLDLSWSSLLSFDSQKDCVWLSNKGGRRPAWVWKRRSTPSAPSSRVRHWRELRLTCWSKRNQQIQVWSMWRRGWGKGRWWTPYRRKPRSFARGACSLWSGGRWRHGRGGFWGKDLGRAKHCPDGGLSGRGQGYIGRRIHRLLGRQRSQDSPRTWVYWVFFAFRYHTLP